MGDQSCNGSEKEKPADVVEFNWPLRIYKRRPAGRTEYLYTIAVWKGTTLVSICLLQPLDVAMKAIADHIAGAGIAESADLDKLPAAAATLSIMKKSSGREL
jgi:hypothetical protein